MHHLNPKKAGLALGALIALIHVVWSALVALGWAQGVVEFILWAHMIHINYIVGPFDGTAFITLIVVTAALGYIVGFVFASIWNKIHK